MESQYYFVYILQSKKDKTFYIGQTNDLDSRMSKHSEGMSKYTASKTPWKLVYFEMFQTRKEALIREKQLKNWKNGNRYRQLIYQWNYFQK